MARDLPQQPPPPPSPPQHQNPWRQTPLIESANLSKAAGCRIFLKLDLHQPSGSFKSRGIGAYCLHALTTAPDPTRLHFYSSSGGNAGLAAVHAAQTLGRPCTVVVPLSTKPLMIAKLRAAGAAQVVQRGASWKEADGYMREVVMAEAERAGEVAVGVHPFDDPVVWDGNATVVEEVEEQMVEMGVTGGPDVVVASVGGGGLFCGLVQGILEDERRRGLWGTEILAVETLGAESLARALGDGRLVTLEGITSLATSLGATRVAERTFELARKWEKAGRVRSVVLSDAEAAMGCWCFADDERMLVELSCGVNLALCYGGRLEKALGRPVRKDEKVVIEVCGGQNVTAGMVEGWRQEYGDLDAAVDGDTQKVANVPSAADAPKRA
ncbi:hypothetical protein B0A50_04871 [Salinomyces thailandicus]|uniref:L-serine ammonia-lyase n=1 Tax=Salinomyces thailandicus TaxID=706561 RepID=A0A4U0TYY3_9PEZI|nr:hypothetical protein B0A50_04871 [Salinomyces thailandica]